jgi:signal recognition particle subunit SRP54
MRQVAIIDSMTRQERRHPDILKASRKKRIAAGSGVKVEDVNRLLKMHRQMADMMKAMGKQKGGGMLGKMMGALGGGMGGGMGGMPPGGMPNIDPAQLEKLAKQMGGGAGLPPGLGKGMPGLPGLGGKLPGLGGIPGFGKKK